MSNFDSELTFNMCHILPKNLLLCQQVCMKKKLLRPSFLEYNVLHALFFII